MAEFYYSGQWINWVPYTQRTVSATGNYTWGPTVGMGQFGGLQPNNRLASLEEPAQKASSVEEETDMSKFVNNFEVGADPEFVVLWSSNGALRNVADLGQGEVGFDHSGKCAELRPEKTKGTYTLVKRIRELINAAPPLAKYRASAFKWRGGAYFNGTGGPVALGGHIHFNIPANKFPKDGLNALDRVTQFFEATDILPTVECTARRSLSQYGKLGEIRTDTPDQHIEYRTMPSWLYDPWIAMLVLTSAKLAVASPETALDNLPEPKSASRRNIEAFLGRFRSKDVNADRVLDKLERSAKWLDIKPDTDLKETWAQPL